MSFSSEVKEELSHLKAGDLHCVIAELAAIISLSGGLARSGQGDYRLRLHTENAAAARRFYTLIRTAFDIQPKVSAQRHNYLKKTRSFQISLDRSGDALMVLKATGLINNLGEIDEVHSRVHDPLLQRTCCRRAYLRGAFLASGSVTDPEKNYHFEIVCSQAESADQIRELFAFFGLDARIVLRKKYHVVYMKEGTTISDAMNVLGAHISLMKFENIRIVKDVRNSVNRRVNCEAANINKTVSAARKQIEDIEYIKKTIGLDKLSGGLRDIAGARLEDPEASLKELGEMLSPAVGKSGVNHRLRKLSQIAQHIRESGHA
ncbi:MAG: DNA-binding protein WhiA [Eubacterium sp.]|nr:DNA-binding protein WhiA [Eubacterium sp.]